MRSVLYVIHLPLAPPVNRHLLCLQPECLPDEQNTRDTLLHPDDLRPGAPCVSLAIYTLISQSRALTDLILFCSLDETRKLIVRKYPSNSLAWIAWYEIPTLVFEHFLHIYVVYTLYRTRIFLSYRNSEESLVVLYPLAFRLLCVVAVCTLMISLHIFRSFLLAS